jgi:acetyl esterase/lipase
MIDLFDLPTPKSDQRLAYGKHPLQFGDLYFPDSAGPHQLVLALHGGFWREKYDLGHFGHLCRALAAGGLAVYSVEYRRLGHEGGGFPGTFEDVARAAEFLPELEWRFPVVTEGAVVLGHSAGAQLALWLAGRQNAPKASGLRGAAFDFSGVVALAPVADLVAASQQDLGKGVVRDFLGGAPEAQPDRYAAASPSLLLPLGVPQVVLHGTQDDTVPYALSEAYVNAARAKGDRVELQTLQGMGHFEPIDPRSAAFPLVLEAVRRLLL